jgi:hypothetical protein
MPLSTLHRGFTELKPSRWRLALLYVGLLVGPVSWLLSLELGYALSYKACGARAAAWLQAAALSPMVLIGIVAWAIWRLAEVAAPDFDRRWPVWMARAGLILCAFFALVILANDVPIVVLQPCR